MDSDSTEPTHADDGEVAANLQVCQRLRYWRTRAGLSLDTVAESSGLSPGYISQVERGRANPSLETLKKLANGSGRTIGELFGESSGESPDGAGYAVTRAQHRKQIIYPGSGIRNELLSADVQHRMEVIWLDAPSGATSGGHPHSHDGEECGVVLTGCMKFWVGPSQVELTAGDSIYLDSSIPHKWVATGDTKLTAVWIITPPTF